MSLEVIEVYRTREKKANCMYRVKVPEKVIIGQISLLTIITIKAFSFTNDPDTQPIFA